MKEEKTTRRGFCPRGVAERLVRLHLTAHDRACIENIIEGVREYERFKIQKRENG